MARAVHGLLMPKKKPRPGRQGLLDTTPGDEETGQQED
jgi:hypothetical protein